MITLAQLEAEYSAEVLLEVTSTLGIDLKDSYDPDSEELLAIRTAADNLLTSTRADLLKIELS
ncbi:MAG: hypothetical protein KME43_26065 [Myxacorys chilensis ATA2-1-KO14]|jgi:hypothetical protein|nr:hypothetical protein [Myxacorys chilensis ATA2-1-KO14]